MTDSPRRVSEDRLNAIVCHLLETVGVSDDHAQRTARILVTADLRGVVTHGVRMVPRNINRILGGGVTARPHIRERARFGAMAIIDGDNGLGMATGSVAMDMAIEMAREHGIGWVMVQNGNHYGASGCFVLPAVEAGMIGISISQCMPRMSIEGTAEAVVGNNPVAIGAPGPEFPLLLDMATSVVAGTKVYHVHMSGDTVPDEWVARPIEKGREIVFRHFGGPKGSGLAIMTELLTGVLAGNRVLKEVVIPNSRTDPDHVAFTQVAINPHAVLPDGQFERGMKHLVEELKHATPAPGVDEVLLPGERAWRATLSHRKDGIRLDARTVQALETVAKDIGTSIDW